MSPTVENKNCTYVEFERSYIKQLFHVFDHALGTFKKDTHLGFASMFITVSTFITFSCLYNVTTGYSKNN